ncbi:NfrA family protein [Trinickia diaoshuihuensis]|uniref:NfrA family protein n=1 Tax=Trinickia diaoshuihuensis TaxID=2292265 RepID=UPI000E25B279|nr:tetratricopeptide repeat protein [Trinickia diaoshuihuensis]
MKRARTARARRLPALARTRGLAAFAVLALHAAGAWAGAQALTPRAYRLADAAYKAIAAGDLAQAEGYASRALKAQPSNLQLGLLLLDVYVREGKIEEADRQAQALRARYPDDGAVLAQHGFLQQKQQRYDEAAADFSAALERGTWDDAQQRNLRLAWADSALAAHEPEQAEKALKPLEGDPDAGIELRIAQLRLRNGDRKGALAAAQLAQAHAATDDDRKSAAALIDFAQQPEPDPKNEEAQKTLQHAYDLLRENKDGEALGAFEQGFALGGAKADNYADAGYAAKRLGQNDEAVKMFEASLDADEHDHAFDDQRRFGYRREVQQLERSWGFVVSLPYQVSAFSYQGTVSVLQPGIEAYWQPPKIGFRNGRILQFFVRGYGTAYDGSGNVTGAPTLQGSIGARYKPLVDQNLVLSAERLVRLGSQSQNDWLARLGYSSEAGNDLRVTEPSWRAWQVYAEADYFLHQGRYILYSQLRYGHTWALSKINDHLTVYPHLAFILDYDSKERNQTAMSVGPGVQFRFWFREGRYSAPASYADLTVQYHVPLTSAARARGLAVQLTLWY